MEELSIGVIIFGWPGDYCERGSVVRTNENFKKLSKYRHSPSPMIILYFHHTNAALLISTYL